MSTKTFKKTDPATLRELRRQLRPVTTLDEFMKIVRSKKRHSPEEWVVIAEKLAWLNRGHALTKAAKPKAKKAVPA